MDKDASLIDLIGCGPFEQDPLEKLGRLAEQGFVEAQREFGLLLIRRKINIELGVAWLKQAISMGCPRAHVELADHYISDGNSCQHVEGLNLLISAGDKGYWQAIRRLALGDMFYRKQLGLSNEEHGYWQPQLRLARKNNRSSAAKKI